MKILLLITVVQALNLLVFAWYNHGRVHQGLKGIPDPDPALSKPRPLAGRLAAFPVLNGLHHDYRLVA